MIVLEIESTSVWQCSKKKSLRRYAMSRMISIGLEEATYGGRHQLDGLKSSSTISSPRRRAVALQSGNSAKLGHYWLVNL